MSAIARRICEAAARGISTLGVDARYRPRNDIEVDGKKISGTGGVFEGDALMYQGTLLVQFDVEKMLRVLRIPAEKLSDKAIASARERVANLADLLGFVPPLEQVKAALADALGTEFGVHFAADGLLPPEQVRFEAALAEIDTPEWVDQVSRPASDMPVVEAVRKFPGGVLHVSLALDAARHRIAQAWFTGDFFISPRRAVADLEAALRNTPAEQMPEIVHAFFSGRGVDMLQLQPADFVVVIQQALAHVD
jgi:lipoate-protein ligase A